MPISLTGGAIPAPPKWFTRRYRLSSGSGNSDCPGNAGAAAPVRVPAPRADGSGPQAGVRARGERGDPRTSVLEFGPLPTAVPCARLHARNVFAEWRLPPGVAADAEVLVSELITNALRATWSLRDPQPIALRMRASDWWLLIEAWDHCPGDPAAQPVPFAPESGRDLPEGGRGLAVIEAYSDHWGCLRVNERMKAVWCELRLAPAVASDKATAQCVYEGEK